MDLAWRRSLARSLTMVEERRPGWRETLARAHAVPASTLVIGITGPPGAGKSTLVDGLAAHWAAEDQKVGILAIDPASPFSGGAVLGDRIRMQRCGDNPRVFIRSMSARGHGGGLNQMAAELCTVFAAAGVSRILLETVGVGQNDIEVAFVADCTVMVAVPGLGDAVQAAKAGLMEVADIYVVNKADLPGAATVAGDIRAMLSLVFAGRPGWNRDAVSGGLPAAVPGAARQRLCRRYGDPAGTQGFWHPPVVTSIATHEDSMAALAEAIFDFEQWYKTSGQADARRLERSERQLRNILVERLIETHLEAAGRLTGQSFASWIQSVAARRIDPHAAADRILEAEEKPTREN